MFKCLNLPKAASTVGHHPNDFLAIGTLGYIHV